MGGWNDIELFQARIKFRIETVWIEWVMCFCSHSDSQNHLMDCRIQKKKKKKKYPQNIAHGCTAISSKNDIVLQRLWKLLDSNKVKSFLFLFVYCCVTYLIKTQCLTTRICSYCSWYWGLTWSRLGGSYQSLSGDYSQLVTGEEIIWRLSWAEYLLTHRAEVNSYCYLGTESCLPGCLYSAFLCGFSFSEHAI